MDSELRSTLAIVAATAGTFFALGAYYQHQHVIRNIKKLEQRNPHAFFIRRKLYALLNIFRVNENAEVYEDSGDVSSHKLGSIMKYGFPSMNEISLNETFNFVTSFDRRNSAIQWMCEHIEHRSSTPTNTNLNLRQTPLHQTEAGRVFFMSNIKPFLSRGFNLRIWEQLQRYVQEVAHDYGSVYVYTGSIYLPREVKCSSWYLEFQPEDTSLVAVPTHFFKVLIIEPSRRDNAPYAESYVLPNLNIKDNLDLRMLLCDLRDIENATGLKFFDGLDRNFVNTQPVQQPSGSQTIACN